MDCEGGTWEIDGAFESYFYFLAVDRNLALCWFGAVRGNISLFLVKIYGFLWKSLTSSSYFIDLAVLNSFSAKKASYSLFARNNSRLWWFYGDHIVTIVFGSIFGEDIGLLVDVGDWPFKIFNEVPIWRFTFNYIVKIKFCCFSTLSPSDLNVCHTGGCTGDFKVDLILNFTKDNEFLTIVCCGGT